MTEFMIRDVHDWEMAASDTFVPLECSSETSDFSGSIATKELSDTISLARVRSGQVRVTRTSSLARKSEHDDLLMSIQLRSQSYVHQHDRIAIMRPGDAVFYEANRPYTLDHPQSGQDLLVVKIGRQELGFSDRTIRQLCGRSISGSVPGMTTLVGYFIGLAHETFEGPFHSTGDLGRLSLDMISTVIRSYTKTSQANIVENASLLEQVKRYIRQNFSDSRVTVDRIAAAHYISVRKLHNLFNEIHETPGQYLRRMRLEHAAHLLAYATLNKQTVASIAHQVGFSNASTFSRSYKNYYGIPPTHKQNHTAG